MSKKEETTPVVEKEEIVITPIIEKLPDVKDDGDEPTDKVIEIVPQPEEPKSDKTVKETEEVVATPEGVVARTTTTTSEVIVDEDKIKGFAVFSRVGEYIRIYTPKLHGKNAEKLAKQFADKIKGTVSKQ